MANTLTFVDMVDPSPPTMTRNRPQKMQHTSHPNSSAAPGHARRLGEAARMKQLVYQQRSRHLPGSENYRPLVGGFAAAAYEAAKEDHYNTPEEERKYLDGMVL